MEIKYGINSASNFKIGGFATGSYQCKCVICSKLFMGDKRAVQCLKCAINPEQVKQLSSAVALLEKLKAPLAEFSSEWYKEVDYFLKQQPHQKSTYICEDAFYSCNRDNKKCEGQCGDNFDQAM